MSNNLRWKKTSPPLTVNKNIKLRTRLILSWSLLEGFPSAVWVFEKSTMCIRDRTLVSIRWQQYSTLYMLLAFRIPQNGAAREEQWYSVFVYIIQPLKFINYCDFVEEQARTVRKSPDRWRISHFLLQWNNSSASSQQKDKRKRPEFHLRLRWLDQDFAKIKHYLCTGTSSVI